MAAILFDDLFKLFGTFSLLSESSKALWTLLIHCRFARSPVQSTVRLLASRDWWKSRLRRLHTYRRRCRLRRRLCSTVPHSYVLLHHDLPSWTINQQVQDCPGVSRGMSRRCKGPQISLSRWEDSPLRDLRQESNHPRPTQ